MRDKQITWNIRMIRARWVRKPTKTRTRIIGIKKAFGLDVGESKTQNGNIIENCWIGNFVELQKRRYLRVLVFGTDASFLGSLLDWQRMKTHCDNLFRWFVKFKYYNIQIISLRSRWGILDLWWKKVGNPIMTKLERNSCGGILVFE